MLSHELQCYISYSDWSAGLTGVCYCDYQEMTSQGNSSVREQEVRRKLVRLKAHTWNNLHIKPRQKIISQTCLTWRDRQTDRWRWSGATAARAERDASCAADGEVFMQRERRSAGVCVSRACLKHEWLCWNRFTQTLIFHISTVCVILWSVDVSRVSPVEKPASTG